MTIRPGLPAVLATLLIGMVTGLGPLGCTGRSAETDPPTESTWLVTVYYTAVESFHSGSGVTVHGCPVMECANGSDLLGTYPQSFVNAVRDEGTGRITTGTHAGRYLNWSHDVGYWLDDAPRDAHGRPLLPFRSAAADGLPEGSRLRLVDCGAIENGKPVPDEVCQALRNGEWEIRDRFTPGLGGPQHIDLYIGEETAPQFTTSGALYVTLYGAVFTIGD